MDEYQTYPHIDREKASELPEDIKARIVKLGKNTYYNAAHGKSIINERIIDAGTSPFSKSEIEWLLHVRRIMVVTAERDGYARSSTFTPLLSKDMIDNVTIADEYIVDFNGEGYELSFNMDEPNSIKGKTVVKNLIGRLDSSIIKPSNLATTHDMEGDPYYANLVLLDIRSIFVILRKRFQIVIGNNTNRSIELAREYTQKILDNIVNSFDEYRMFALLMYLLTSALILDVEIKVMNYFKTYDTDILSKLNNDVFKEIDDKCDHLYNILSNIISHMI